MRWLLALATLLVLAPAAHAGTIAREGTELVYRSDPGQRDYIVIQDVGASPNVSAGGTGVTPGAGCERRSCAISGITAVRVFAGDGNDQVEVYVDLPVIADLGSGDDYFGGRGSSLTVSAGDGEDLIGGTADGGTVDGGPGNDRLRIDATDESSGPQVMTGGPGDDELRLEGLARAEASVAGGDGDDEIAIEAAGTGPGADVSCGPGNDRVRLDLDDRAGEGCAARVTGVTPRTVSRAFREGELAGPAAVAVTLYPSLGRGTLAQGFATFTAAGPLRVRLKPTAAGRRAIRRDPRLELGVRIRARTGGDVNDYWFGSRLTR